MELLVRQWGWLNRCFPNGPLSTRRIIIGPHEGVVHLCVCVYESLASVCPYCFRLSHLPVEGGGEMLPYAFMCVCICECLTYVGVKNCYIFTSCCLSLLIDAQQQCRMALNWPLSTPPLKRRVLTYLGVRKMFPSLKCFRPSTPFCRIPPTQHIRHAQFVSFFVPCLPCILFLLQALRFHLTFHGGWAGAITMLTRFRWILV